MKRVWALIDKFSERCDAGTRKPVTFLLACVVIVVWAASGPHFGFSDTWQLVINTGTTIVTFLMVFLLANSQGRAADRHYALTERVEKLEERVIDDLEGPKPK